MPCTLGLRQGVPGPCDWPGLEPAERAPATLASSLRPLTHKASRAPPLPAADVSCPREGHCLPGILIVSQPQQPQKGVQQLWFLVLPLLSYKDWVADAWTGVKLPS